MKFCKAMAIASMIAVVSFAGDVQDGLDALKKGDHTRAAALWERGCKANEAKACYNLSLLYKGGYSIEANKAEQTRLQNRACDLGYSQACTAERAAENATAAVVAAPVEPVAVATPVEPVAPQKTIFAAEPIAAAPQEPMPAATQPAAQPKPVETTKPKPVAKVETGANPNEGLYLGGRLNFGKYEVSLGGDFEGSESDSVTPISLVVGKSWDMGNPQFKFRGEAELTTEQKYTEDYDDGYDSGSMSVKTTALMFNGYLDFATNNDKVTPYVGLGLGFAKNKFSWDESIYCGYGCYYSAEGSGSDTTIAYQLMAGVGFDINSNFKMDGGLKIANYGSVSGDITLKDPAGYEVGAADITGDTSSVLFYIGAYYKF